MALEQKALVEKHEAKMGLQKERIRKLEARVRWVRVCVLSVD